jgi:hypothetical protein
MSTRGGVKRATFAQIVADVEARPTAFVEPLVITPGKFSGDKLYDLAGHQLTEIDGPALEPDEVRAGVLDGALVVWDACGCGGYCNALVWPEPADLRREAMKSGPRYRKGDPGRVTRWTGDGGDVLLIQGGYRWGDLFR